MSSPALAAHRAHQRSRGLKRVELQVPADDAPLLRAIAAALTDPARASAARTLLHDRFAAAPAHSLKDLLASAPLDGVDLSRSRDTGRPVKL